MSRENKPFCAMVGDNHLRLPSIPHYKHQGIGFGPLWERYRGITIRELVLRKRRFFHIKWAVNGPSLVSMHISEGILAGTPHGQAILLAGAAAAAAGTAVGLRKLDYERVPRAAVLGAAFFVASSIHVPLGPTSVHLVLSGLLGLVLGWAVFPVVLVGLILQAAFFGVGGPTTLGLNVLVMALPAVACYYLFHSVVRYGREPWVFAAGFAAGAAAIFLGASLTAAALMLAGKQFEAFGAAVLIGHLPLALIEGFVAGSATALVRKVRPELLDAPLLDSHGSEVLDA